jgi:hypothetical protein
LIVINCRPVILGSFGRSSVASRSKRRPVVFCHRPSAGLALSSICCGFFYTLSCQTILDS